MFNNNKDGGQCVCTCHAFIKIISTLYPDFPSLSSENKLTFLLSNPDIVSIIAPFLLEDLFKKKFILK
jgi:hypothetical protein